jgi:translation initiation factor IF-1
MPGKDAFTIEGRVVEILPGGIYRAELANGHRLRAYVAGRAKRTFRQLSPGDVVSLALSPYDLSEGRILPEVK